MATIQKIYNGGAIRIGTTDQEVTSIFMTVAENGWTRQMQGANPETDMVYDPNMTYTNQNGTYGSIKVRLDRDHYYFGSTTTLRSESYFQRQNWEGAWGFVHRFLPQSPYEDTQHTVRSVITQFQAAPNSPQMSIRRTGEKFRFETKHKDPSDPTKVRVLGWDLIPAVHSKWNKFVVLYKLREDGTGYYYCYVNGKELVRYQGPTVFEYKPTNARQFKWGNYSSPIKGCQGDEGENGTCFTDYGLPNNLRYWDDWYTLFRLVRRDSGDTLAEMYRAADPDGVAANVDAYPDGSLPLENTVEPEPEPEPGSTYTAKANRAPEEAGDVEKIKPNPVGPDVGPYSTGDIVRFEATVNAGWKLDGWFVKEATADDSTYVTLNSTSLIYDYTVQNFNAMLQARFSLESIGGTTYILTLDSTAGGSAVALETNVFEQGTIVQLSATANAGFTFDKWTRSGITISSVASFDYTTRGQDDTLIAEFIEAPTIPPIEPSDAIRVFSI